MSHFKAKMHKVQFPQLVKQAAINSVVASFVKLFSSCIGNIQTKYCVPTAGATRWSSHWRLFNLAELLAAD